MAKISMPGIRELEYYTINGTDTVVKVGDAVLMRILNNKIPYVGLLETIEADNSNRINVRVRCYFRPEQTKNGRRVFHGVKELYLSDNYAVLSADTIIGKCVVHSFTTYTKLKNVGAEDYYCRFEFKVATGTLEPDRIAVYCKCEMPKNPDIQMVKCEGCRDWYHPACLNMTIEAARKLDRFQCPECASAYDVIKLEDLSSSSTVTNGKVVLKHPKK